MKVNTIITKKNEFPQKVEISLENKTDLQIFFDFLNETEEVNEKDFESFKSSVILD